MTPELYLWTLLWSSNTPFTSLLGCLKTNLLHNNSHFLQVSFLFVCLLACLPACFTNCPCPNLEVILDSSLSLNSHIKIISNCYLNLLIKLFSLIWPPYCYSLMGLLAPTPTPSSPFSTP